MIELVQLYARYSFGVDSLSPFHLQACFTDDVSFGVVGEPPSEGIKNVVQRLLSKADPAVVHHAFNVVILEESDPTALRVRADFTMTRLNELRATGYYVDEVVPVPDGTLRFRKRAITFTWSTKSA